MNPHLRRYLKLAPGVKTRNSEPIITFVNPQDRPSTLRIPMTRELQFSVGQWVKISRGTYTNDIGCIKKLKEWGGVQVLLVPRLSPSSSKINKRPRPNLTLRTEPMLFDATLIQKLFDTVPKLIASNTYVFRGRTYEHGLLVEELSATAVSPSPVFIPSQVATMFLRSKHPFIMSAKLPSPAEWSFTVDDLVEIDCGPFIGKLGHVKIVQPDSLEIDLSDGGGRVLCNWYDVRKWFVPGDPVKVTGGTEVGRTGLVDKVFPTEVSILEGGGGTKVEHASLVNEVLANEISILERQVVEVNISVNSSSLHQLLTL
jgi:transcription antitermination factor NusG